MKFFNVLAATVCTIVLASAPQAAAYTYTDSSDNYPDGWDYGSNGGEGFGAWRIYRTESFVEDGSAGFGIWDPSVHNDFQGSWAGKTRAFGLLGKGSGWGVYAFRPFRVPLAVGDSFSFDMAVNWDSDIEGALKGFVLSAYGEDVITVNHGAYPGHIYINGDDGDEVLNATPSDGKPHPMTWTFLAKDATTVTVTANSRVDGTTVYERDWTVSSSSIDGIRLQSVGQANQDEGRRVTYYDNFKLELASELRDYVTLKLSPDGNDQWAVTRASQSLSFILKRSSPEGELVATIESSAPAFVHPAEVTFADGQTEASVTLSATLTGGGDYAELSASGPDCIFYGKPFQVKGPEYACNAWDDGVDKPWQLEVGDTRTFWVDNCKTPEEFPGDDALVTVESTDAGILEVGPLAKWAIGDGGNAYTFCKATGIADGQVSVKVLYDGVEMTNGDFTVFEPTFTLSGPTNVMEGKTYAYTLSVATLNTHESAVISVDGDARVVPSSTDVEPGESKTLSVTFNTPGDITLTAATPEDKYPVSLDIVAAERPDYSGYIAYDDAVLYDDVFDEASTGKGTKGFAAWNVYRDEAQNGGVHVAASAPDALSGILGIGTALGLYANGEWETNTYEMYRGFNGDLGAGQEFSIDFACEASGGNRYVQIVRMEKGTCQPCFEVCASEGRLGVNLEGFEGGDIGWAPAARVVHLSVLRSADGFTYTLSLSSGSESWTKDIPASTAMWTDGLQGFIIGASNSEGDLFFNRMAIRQVHVPVVDYAALPFAGDSMPYGGPWQDATVVGLSSQGLGDDNADGSARFDGPGDWMLVKFDGIPGTLSYGIKGNGLVAERPITFLVQESATGADDAWTTLATYVSGDNLEEARIDASHELSPSSRFIRFFRETQGEGDVGIYDVYISTTEFYLSLDPAQDFGVECRAEDAVITATARNAVGEVDYSWKAVSRAGHGSGNVFQIDTSATGDPYTVTCVARDEGGSEASASVSFRVLTPGAYSITVADDIPNGTIAADMAAAVEGKRVTLYAYPDDGFRLWTFLVDGEAIEGDTFEMPGRDVTVSAVFGRPRATYFVKSTSEVSVTGDPPERSTAEYRSTYKSKYQLTATNSMTLTLSGYKGSTITGLILRMKSNAAGGAGSLRAACGETVIAGIEDSAFNSENWHGAWSTNYVDIAPAVTETTVAGDVDITIAASSNSLYCQSFTVIYVPGGPAPYVEHRGNTEMTLPDGVFSLAFKLYNYSGEYRWTLEGNGAIGSDGVYRWTPTEAGNYRIKVSAVADGETLAKETVDLKVNPGIAKYPVTVDGKIRNGTITVNVREAAEGDIVTVTATPANGYNLSGIFVNGEPIAGNTFAMPAEAVTVSATFVKGPLYYFERVNCAADLEEGEYVITSTETWGGEYAMAAVLSSNRPYFLRPQGGTMRKENKNIVTGDDSIVWSLGKNGDNWTLYNTALGYIGYLASGNSVGAEDTATGKSSWTISDYNGLFLLTNVGNASRYLLYFRAMPRFACFDKPTTGTALSFYRKAGVLLPTIKYSGATETTLLEGAFEIAFELKNFKRKYSWALEGEGTIGEDGVFRWVPSAAGNYRITVSAAEDGETLVSATVGLTVRAQAVTYEVRIADDIPNGTIAADRAGAEEGDLVTLTAFPADGYKLASFLIDGEPIAGNAFVMPAAGVLVSATFVEREKTIFGKITDPNDFEDGEYVITGANEGAEYAMKAEISTGSTKFLLRQEEEVEFEDGGVVAPDASIVWRMFRNGDGWTIYNVAVGYVGYVAGGNSAGAEPAASDKSTWTLSESGNAGLFLVENAGTAGRCLLYNASTPRFACYEEAAAGKALAFYRKSGPVLARYAVTVDGAIANGTVAVNFGEACEGDIVTVTATPSRGYKLEGIAVNGHPIAGNTFAMPAGTVTVSATFVKRPVYCFEKVDWVKDLEEGEYVITGATTNGAEYAMKAEISSGSTKYIMRQEEEVLVEDDTIVGADDSIVWNLARNGDNWSLHNAAVGYVGYVATGNSAGAEDTVSGKSSWTISDAGYSYYAYDDYHYYHWYKGLFLLANVENTNRYLLFYNTTPRFSCYEHETSGKTLAFYKKAGVLLPSIKYSGNTVTTFSEGAFEIAFALENYDGAYSWSLEGEGAIGEDGVYTWVPTAAGRYGITVSATADGETIVSGTVGLTVEAPLAPPATYEVRIADGILNGTVEADRGWAEEGDIVTLSAFPADGYKLRSFLVNGQPIAGNTFEMPAAGVLVSATFVELAKITYGKITAPDGFVDGEYVITGATTNGVEYAMKAEISTGSTKFLVRQEEEVEFEDGAVADPDDSIVWRMFRNGDGWTLYNAAVGYVGYVASGNSAGAEPAATDKSTWTLSESGNEGLFLVENAGTAGRYLLYNATSPRFACYGKTTSGKALAFYRKPGPVLVRYAVTVDGAIENGTVAVNVEEACEGDIVTVKALPAAGCKLGTIWVNGEAIEGNTFTMAAGEAFVSATFVAKPGNSATYTVVEVTEVTATGNVPEGSSASYSQTGSVAGQAMAGNSLTLTLTGYEGKTITGLRLWMRSNSYQGAGSLRVTCGDAVLASIADTKFNSANWNGAWSTSYVTIMPEVTPTAVDGNVLITITGSENSLYCQEVTIEYEPTSGQPRIAFEGETSVRMGEGFSIAFALEDYEGEYVWSLEGKGSIDDDGLYVWTPTAAGTYGITVSALGDGGAVAASLFLKLTVEPGPVPVGMTITSIVVESSVVKGKMVKQVLLTVEPTDVDFVVKRTSDLGDGETPAVWTRVDDAAVSAGQAVIQEEGDRVYYRIDDSE